MAVAGSGSRLKSQVVAAARSPARTSLEELGPGDGEDEDRPRGGMLGEMLHEVEQAGVGPVEILEDEDGRPVVGHPLEERPPGGEGLLALAAGSGAEAEQGREIGSDPLPGPLVRDRLPEVAGQPTPAMGRAVALADPDPVADHVGQRPEGETLAVGGRPGPVPEDLLDHPVDVLLELPDEPALADAGLPEDRDEPDRALLADGMKELLDDAERAVPADQRSLGQLAPSEPAAEGHDLARLPGLDRLALAPQRPVAGRLEGDRPRRDPMGGVVDQDRPGSGRGLESRGRVHDVAGDHPLADRADGHGGLAAHHPGPGRQVGQPELDRPASRRRRRGRSPPGPRARRRPRGRPGRPTSP